MFFLFMLGRTLKLFVGDCSTFAEWVEIFKILHCVCFYEVTFCHNIVHVKLTLRLNKMRGV